MVKCDKLIKAMAGFRRGPGRPRQTRRSGYKRSEGDGMELIWEDVKTAAEDSQQ